MSGKKKPSKVRYLKLRRRLAKIISEQLKIDLQLDNILKDIKKLNKITTKLK